MPNDRNLSPPEEQLLQWLDQEYQRRGEVLVIRPANPQEEKLFALLEKRGYIEEDMLCREGEGAWLYPRGGMQGMGCFKGGY